MADVKQMQDLMDSHRKTIESKENAALSEFKQQMVAATKAPTEETVKELE